MDGYLEIELIDKYLRGMLTQEERRSFERRLQQDPSFAHEFSLHRGIKEAITDQGTEQLQDTLRELRQEWEKSNPPKVKRPFPRFTARLSIAATVLLIVMGSIFLYMYRTPSFSSADDLATQYYKPYEREMVRGGNSTIDIHLQNALTEYDKEHYQRALVYLDSVTKLHPDHIKANFYKAHCYLNLGEQPRAIELFNKIIAHGDNVYIDDAMWFLAMAYLKEGDLDNTVTTLEKINDGSSHRKDAKRLLSDIDKLKGEGNP